MSAWNLTYTALFYSGMNSKTRRTWTTPSSHMVAAIIFWTISSRRLVSWMHKQWSERKAPSRVQETESPSMAFFSRILLKHPARNPQEQFATKQRRSPTPQKTHGIKNIFKTLVSTGKRYGRWASFQWMMTMVLPCMRFSNKWSNLWCTYISF